VDTTGDVWLYRPPRHKTAHKGKERAIFIGPKAQAVLADFPTDDPGDFVFSPIRMRRERFGLLRAARKTPVQPSQVSRAKSRPKRWPTDRYTPRRYHQAVRKACIRAGVGHWHPNQLRHAAATTIRKQFGLEAAQVALGHAKANTTEIYAERNMTSRPASPWPSDDPAPPTNITEDTMTRNRIQQHLPGNGHLKTRSPARPGAGASTDREGLIGHVDALTEGEALELCRRILQRRFGCRLDDLLKRAKELDQDRKYLADLLKKRLDLDEEFRRLSADDRRRIQRQRDEFADRAKRLAARLARYTRQPKPRDAMFRALETRMAEKPDEEWQTRYFAMRKQFPDEMKKMSLKGSLQVAYARWRARPKRDR
jgi:hypothetical protein